MRRLTARQPVTFDFDGGGGSVDCRVAVVTGQVARLAAMSDITDGARARLATGVLGYLVFKHRGAPVGLRGAARTAAGDHGLDFVVVDGIQVVERRIAERVPLIVRARVIGPGGPGSAVETVTANVSMTGALLVGRPELERDSDFQIEMFFDSDPKPVCAGVSVARRLPTHVSVMFTDIAETDRARLSAVLTDRLTRRPSPAPVR
jgi:hypothetical protein